MTATAATIAGPKPATSPFRPASPCGPGCVIPASRRMPWPVRAARVVALIVVVCAAAVGASMVQIRRSDRTRRPAGRRVLRRTARAILAVLGVRFDPSVALPRERALVVANHISWLDIVALLASNASDTSDASGRLRLVAKAEVGTWPVIGRLARLAGTIFIDRGRPRTLPDTLTEVRDALSSGDVVVVFVEGTTCCGAHRAPYRPAMFQAALDVGARVVPLSIGYTTGDGETTTAPAFLGDETLATSIARIVSEPTVHIGMRTGPTLYPQPGADRRRLARAAHA